MKRLTDAIKESLNRTETKRTKQNENKDANEKVEEQPAATTKNTVKQ